MVGSPGTEGTGRSGAERGIFFYDGKVKGVEEEGWKCGGAKGVWGTSVV